MHLESGGTLAKRALLYMTKIKDFMSFTSRTKIFENMEFLIGNGLYTESLLLHKGHRFFPEKEGVHSRNPFSFLKWGTFEKQHWLGTCLLLG